LSEFSIAEAKTFAKRKKTLDPALYSKIKTVVYPQLRRNPHFGPNIRKLKGEFAGYYRFRIGRYRLFYLVEDEKILVIVVDLRHRQNACK
jgi:mRNA interferase RelE/StbE